MKAAMVLIFASLAFCATRPSDTFETSAGEVRITPIQHASLMIEAAGNVIQVDPVGNFYQGLPDADLILITDIHGDHMSPPTIAKLKKAGTVIIAPQLGLDPENIVPAAAKTVTEAQVLRNGESKTWSGWTIEAIPMYNLKRGPSAGTFFHDKGRGNGYVLTYGGKRFYISGDTEGIPEMRALKSIDVAFVCMNLPYTMPPEEAADAVKAFKPKVVYPYHYRGSDLAAFQKGLEGSGIEVRLRDWYAR
jgi:L-ascorbate metabolism protein UlaG (beta-lactamase superfamily)